MALPAGVPNLLFPSDASAFQTFVQLTTDSFIDYGLGQPPQWGVFQNGVPVVIADTVTDFAYQQDWSISDYPVERGGFESYDKVNSPFRVRIQFISGGDEANRQTLLDSIVAIGDTTDLYDVITPTAVYSSVNVEHYDYRRTSRNGLGLLIVDVHFLEIREDGAHGFQNPVSPSGFAAQPAGNVQSTDITQSLSGVQ